MYSAIDQRSAGICRVVVILLTFFCKRRMAGNILPLNIMIKRALVYSP